MTDFAEDPRFIPTSVRAAVAIRNATENPAIGEHDIERMVCAEPVVASALLRMANSAAYRLREPVTDVGQAVFTLGLAHVRSVASHVAMLQLVHGIQPRAARAIAEAVLLHSISVAAFAERLGRERGHQEAPRLASLGLFHELPVFLFLAQANRLPEEFASLASAQARMQRIALRSYELIMNDLGLPELAVLKAAELAFVDRAHAYVAHRNPLRAHPADGGKREELTPEQIAATQAKADADFVNLVEGVVVRSHQAATGAAPAAVAPPAAQAPVREPMHTGLIARVERLWDAIFK